ncbi:MAG: serine hydrolase domain-containing protein [Pseudomonadota bacterium]
MFDVTTNPARLGFDSERLARFRPWMQRWVDQGKYPGAQVLIARRGELVLNESVGMRDVESGIAWSPDTILRIYSMTKPMTSVAFLMLFEEAEVHLDTPLAEILPEFADVQVLIDGAERIDQVEPLTTPLTVHHLLTHTSGLTYGFNEGVLPTAMNEARVSFGPHRPSGPDTLTVSDDDTDLAAMVSELAQLPLGFQPGARWNYGASTDVLGRVVEVVSGKPLDTFFAEHILGPLEMHDTFFEVPADKADRFTNCYVLTPKDPLRLLDPAAKSPFLAGGVKILSGGGGLLSTGADYLRFAEMLRGGGALGDVRLLAPKTVEVMTRNALRGDLASMGQAVFAEVAFDGIGFGLGVSVTLDPGVAKTVASEGDYGWGGMASTMFWVDPKSELTAMFLTQLVPSSAYPVRKEMRALTYGAMLGG